MPNESEPRDGRHDFDFYVGTWNVHNRRLRERLKGSNDWEEFEGVSVARSILGGIGNIDEIALYRESGTGQGFTLRLYNEETHEWSLYWAANGNVGLVPPMVGRFDANHYGEFYCQEIFNGKHIFSRFIWSGITATTAHWEQAFSEDGGKTWETNWTMDSIRQE